MQVIFSECNHNEYAVCILYQAMLCKACNWYTILVIIYICIYMYILAKSSVYCYCDNIKLELYLGVSIYSLKMQAGN